MDNQSLLAANDVDNILQQYAKMVYRLAYLRTKNGADADDVVQEVFMRYIKSHIHFNSEEHCKAWFIKVTVNCSKSLLASAWFRKTTSLKDNLLTEYEEKSDVFYAVLELPVKYRTLIHLYYYENFSVGEISKLLNVKEATIKTQLHRARNLLQKRLKGEPAYVKGAI